MKTKKTYSAPLASIVKIETKDVIMASGVLSDAKFKGAEIAAGEVYDIQ